MKYILPRSKIALIFIIPLLVTLSLVATIYLGAPFYVYIIGIVFTVMAWYSYMNIPFEIEFDSSDKINLCSISRRFTIKISDIKQIDARPWNRGLVTLYYNRSEVALFRSTPGIKEIIQTIRANNKGVVFKGSF